jgi:hypothetical protein
MEYTTQFQKKKLPKLLKRNEQNMANQMNISIFNLLFPRYLLPHSNKKTALFPIMTFRPR